MSCRHRRSTLMRLEQGEAGATNAGQEMNAILEVVQHHGKVEAAIDLQETTICHLNAHQLRVDPTHSHDHRRQTGSVLIRDVVSRLETGRSEAQEEVAGRKSSDHRGVRMTGEMLVEVRLRHLPPDANGPVKMRHSINLRGLAVEDDVERYLTWFIRRV